jgi:hypothetical protein
MDRTLKAALTEFLAEGVPRAAPGFTGRKLKANDRSRYAIAPIAFFSMDCSHDQQFIAFVPAHGGSSSRFYVECGWFSELPVPVATPESSTLVRSHRLIEFALPSQFAVRLFRLCEDRGISENFWDLFSPEVWAPSKESYREFSSRQAFASIDEALRVYSAGGITSEYANSQARLVAGDCLSCISNWAVPFLERRRSHSAGETG